jgi:putative membrane protein
VVGLNGASGSGGRWDGPSGNADPSGPAERAEPTVAAEPAERAGRTERTVRAERTDRTVPAAERTEPQRRPLSVYGYGEEPDPRFSLANERTALAWMRTALALVGGGVALISVGSLATLPRWSALIGAAVCVGGALLAWRAVTGWTRVERAMRLRQRLPAPRALPWLAGGVILLAMLTLVLTILQLLRR